MWFNPDHWLKDVFFVFIKTVALVILFYDTLISNITNQQYQCILSVLKYFFFFQLKLTELGERVLTTLQAQNIELVHLGKRCQWLKNTIRL